MKFFRIIFTTDFKKMFTICEFFVKYILNLSDLCVIIHVVSYGGYKMRVRKQALGDRNIAGERVEQRRKSIGMKQKDLLTQLQVRGVDLNASGLSKLEGQLRSINDYELVALAEVLGVSVNWLLGLEK